MGTDHRTDEEERPRHGPDCNRKSPDLSRDSLIMIMCRSWQDLKQNLKYLRDLSMRRRLEIKSDKYYFSSSVATCMHCGTTMCGFN